MANKTRNYICIILAAVFVLLLTGKSRAAAPPQITDLACRADTTMSAVFLYWTVPANVASSVAYEMKYIQGNTMDYDRAAVFSQSWPSGTVGSPLGQLVTGLSPATQFTFAMRARDDSGNWSPVSNQSTCITIQTSKADAVAPTSQILNLSSGQTIPVDVNYIVQGSSFDTGGSSVQKVEISFDNGISWQAVTPKASNDSGFTWEYAWTKPASGVYQIKTRATDWWNNVEAPRDAINVQVAVSQSGGETGGATEAQLRAQIIQIQQQIIQLIRQLIALLQVQLGNR